MVKRLVIRIFNIIFIAAAAICISIYFTKPFITVDASITLHAETFEDMMKGTEGTEGIDFNEIIGEEGIKVELPVVVEPMSLFASIKSNDNAAYIKEEIVDKNVDKIVDTVYPTLKDVVEKTAKQVAKKEVKKEVTSQIKNIMGTGTTDEQVSQKLDEAFADKGGFDQYVEDKTQELLEQFDGTKTVDDFVDTIQSTLDEVQDSLKVIDPEMFGEEIVMDKEAVAEQLTNTLDSLGLVDEDGNISSIDEAINALLSSILGGDGTSSDALPKIMRRSVRGADEGTSEGASDDLKATIRNYINNLIPESLVPTLVTVFKITAFVLIGIMAFWALFGIWTLIKTFAPFRPYTFCGPVFIITCVLQILLGIVLTIALPILKDQEFVQTFINGFISGTGAKGISFDLSVGTSMLIPSIIILVMFVLSFVYNAFKKSVKKQHKLLKADK